MQNEKFLIAPILFLYYEESACSFLLKSEHFSYGRTLLCQTYYAFVSCLLIWSEFFFYVETGHQNLKPPWVHHFDRRRGWSLLYFLIYAFLNISACRKFSLSVSTSGKEMISLELSLLHVHLFGLEKQVLLGNNNVTQLWSFKTPKIRSPLNIFVRYLH